MPNKQVITEVELQTVKNAYSELLRALKIDGAVDDADVTSRLSAELLIQLTKGVHAKRPKLSLIPAPANSSWVVLSEIPFYSLCEHHFVPFWGKVKIKFLPQDSIAGLGGFMRIVDHFCRQPQLQERLCEDIAQAIQDDLKPKSLEITLEARQMCLELRGHTNGIIMETKAVRGSFH